MKVIVFLLLNFVFQVVQMDTTYRDFPIDTSTTIVTPAKVETVKIVIKEKEYTPLINEQNKSEKFIDDLISQIIPVGWKILLILLVVFLMGLLNYRLNRFYNKYNLSSKFKNADLIKVISHILIWTFTVVFILFVILKTSGILVLLVLIFVFIVLIISIGELAKNVVGGIMILIDKPFEYGDWIKIGNYSGKVHSKNLRTTDIITEDDSLIKIPNQLFISSAFENLNVISKNKQVTFIIEIPPRAEISKIKTALNEIVSLSIFNSINKPVEVIYKGRNDKGNLEFQVRAYVFDAKFESEFKSDVQEKVAEIFGVN
ncbi:MAG: mechanosensitive ion channel family protein [Ignavibacteria bacterium]|jgi:small-conductance mechanosensitive channel|nr:mechanosensitive ion channel family protein [Ignavibacteria bacterium]